MRVWFPRSISRPSEPRRTLSVQKNCGRPPTMPSFTELRAKTNAGEEVSFDVYAGKVVLVVNVARL